MKNLKKNLAATGLAITSVAGVGAAMAPSASANPNIMYNHHSANYTSMAQCNYYRSGVSTTILRNNGRLYVAGTCHKEGSHYSYHDIMYFSNRPIIAGDKRAI